MKPNYYLNLVCDAYGDVDDTAAAARLLFNVLSSCRGRAELYGRCEFGEHTFLGEPYFVFKTWHQGTGELFSLIDVYVPLDSPLACLINPEPFFWQAKLDRAAQEALIVKWINHFCLELFSAEHELNSFIMRWSTWYVAKQDYEKCKAEFDALPNKRTKKALALKMLLVDTYGSILTTVETEMESWLKEQNSWSTEKYKQLKLEAYLQQNVEA